MSLRTKCGLVLLSFLISSTALAEVIATKTISLSIEIPNMAVDKDAKIRQLERDLADTKDILDNIVYISARNHILLVNKLVDILEIKESMEYISSRNHGILNTKYGRFLELPSVKELQ